MNQQLTRSTVELGEPIFQFEHETIYDAGHRIQSVFRFFDNAGHVEDFLRGKIWLSTLEVCRNHENSKRGDPGEGSITYYGATATGNGSNEAFVELARRSGINIPLGCTINRMEISNNIVRHRLPDALVLCLTEKYAPEVLSDDFGRFCVEITDQHAFFLRLSQALCERYPITNFMSGLITYADRRYEGMESPPAHIGFLKPPDKYMEQKEFRMLWTVSTRQPLTAGMIDIPDLAQYCRRVG